MSVPSASTSSLYQALNKETREIRLVTIASPPSSSECIECRLANFPLKDAPQYTALSYVWGDIKETAPITLNDTEIQVTTNLLAALQRLRREHRGIYLWIDALCINQSSTEEKNHQVPLMRNIYQQATVVMMWLGMEENDGHLAMSTIETWGKAYTVAYMATYKSGGKLGSKTLQEAALATIEDPFNELHWTAMRWFFNRPYWRRIWIVQEFALSKQAVVVLGEAKVYFPLLEAAVSLWNGLVRTESSTLINFGQQIRITRSGIAPVTRLLMLLNIDPKYKEQKTPFATKLQYILRQTRAQLASDPRDKVYGVLGLIDGDHEGFVPDYSRNVIQVYTDFAIMHIQATGGLSSICFQPKGDLNHEKIPGLPSWVPDLSNRETMEENYIDYNFSAAGNAAFEFALSQDFKVLKARGIIADEIDEIQSFDGESKMVNEVLQSWLEFAAVHAQTFHPTGIPWRQALFRTLIADSSGCGYGRSDFKNNDCRIALYEDAVAFVIFMGKELSKTHSAEEAIDQIHGEEPLERVHSIFRCEKIDYFAKVHLFWNLEIPETETQSYTNALLEEFCGRPGTTGYLDSPTINHSIHMRINTEESFSRLAAQVQPAIQRRLYFTRRGYMGVAPLKARKGDLVCVLLGCNVPLIIRREEDHYLVIGGSYIYGMMNREVIQDARGGKLRYEDLKFR